MKPFKSFVFSSIIGISVLAVAHPGAALSTWLPTYASGQQIYLDPALSRDSTYSVQFTENFTGKLQKAQQQHDLDIYVVAARQGAEKLQPETNVATAKLNDLIVRWGGTALPKDKYLVILWVRRADNPSKGWVAANGGSFLRSRGLTGKFFAAPDGPVIPALKNYMPQDPEGAILAIAQNVNDEISAYERQQQEVAERQRQEKLIQAKEEERERQETLERQQRNTRRRQQIDRFMTEVNTYAPWTLLGVVLIGSGSWIVIRFKHRRQEAKDAIASWQERLANANDLYLRLHDEYFPFLKEQSNWEEAFQGVTQERYRQAAQDFTNFTLRLEAANQRLQTAQSAADKNIFPLVTRYQRANQLLTVEPITVTGEELPLEVAELFKGLAGRNTYQPEQLLNVMSVLFDQINKSLAEIVGVIKVIGNRRQAVHELQSNIKQVQQRLKEQGIPLHPYTLRHQQLCKSWQLCQPQMDADPLNLQQECLHLHGEFQELFSDLEKALSLHEALANTKPDIAAIAQIVKKTRAQPIDYRYPLAPDESIPSDAAEQTFLLNEPELNLDALINQAWWHLQAAQESLGEGKLQAAEDHRQAAIDKARQIDQQVESTANGKAFIEFEVTTARKDLEQLSQKISGAEGAMAVLQAEFLLENHRGQSDNFLQAQQTTRSSQAQLTAIKQAYDRQHYLVGRDQLEVLKNRLAANFTGLAAIHSRLSELRALRKSSRESVTACQRQVETLRSRLESQPWEFTTAGETHAAFESASAALQLQAQDVEKEITDWQIADQKIASLGAELRQIEQAVLAQQREYDKAVTAIGSLKDKIAITQIAITYPDTRPPAHEQFLQAQQKLEELETAITQSNRSDWDDLAAQTAQGLTLMERASKLAESDKKAANEAREAIAKANTAIESADRSYGHGISADLESSRQVAGVISGLLYTLDYEAAKQKAEQAMHSAQEAQAEAKRQAKKKESESSSSSLGVWSSSPTSSWSSGGGGFDGGSGGGGY